jgi:hypothetical protein
VVYFAFGAALEPPVPLPTAMITIASSMSHIESLPRRPNTRFGSGVGFDNDSVSASEWVG